MFSGQVTYQSKGYVQQLSKQSWAYNERDSIIPYLKRDRVVIEFSRVRYYLVTWFLHPVTYFKEPVEGGSECCYVI